MNNAEKLGTMKNEESNADVNSAAPKSQGGMHNAEAAANRAALPTPPFDPTQIVLHLGRAARAVRTVRGPDGRIIQELLFDGIFSGLLFELPPDEGRCRDCGTVLDHAYSTSRQETYGTTPTRCASCKAAQQKRHAAVATGAACTTGEVAGTTNRGAAAADGDEHSGDAQERKGAANASTTFAVGDRVWGFNAALAGWYRATVTVADPGPQGVNPQQGERYDLRYDDGVTYGVGMRLVDVGHPGEFTDEEEAPAPARITAQSTRAARDGKDAENKASYEALRRTPEEMNAPAMHSGALRRAVSAADSRAAEEEAPRASEVASKKQTILTSITPNAPSMCAQATFGAFRRSFVEWAVSLHSAKLSPELIGSGETVGDTFVPSSHAAATVAAELLRPDPATEGHHSLQFRGAGASLPCPQGSLGPMNCRLAEAQLSALWGRLASSAVAQLRSDFPETAAALDGGTVPIGVNELDPTMQREIADYVEAQSIVLGLATECARTMGESSTAYVSLQAGSVDHTLSRVIRKATAAADARCPLQRKYGIFPVGDLALVYLRFHHRPGVAPEERELQECLETLSLSTGAELHLSEPLRTLNQKLAAAKRAGCKRNPTHARLLVKALAKAGSAKARIKILGKRIDWDEFALSKTKALNALGGGEFPLDYFDTLVDDLEDAAEELAERADEFASVAQDPLSVRVTQQVGGAGRRGGHPPSGHTAAQVRAADDAGRRTCRNTAETHTVWREGAYSEA